uniref:Pentatricopeptide repeat-containing protein n=1 Tax=Rhizophora mucronata TaxID=61149 RepID=A0A2P2JI14_RHIMU
MMKRGIVPNITTYNALINGLCKAGNLERAQRLFNKLHLKGLTPNVVTYNILIDGYCKSGNTREALDLRDEMLKEGICPSIVTYSSLIYGFHKKGDSKISMKLLDEMKELYADQNVGKFSKLIEGFITCAVAKDISTLPNITDISCPSVDIKSNQQMQLAELSVAAEMIDSFGMSEALC